MKLELVEGKVYLVEYGTGYYKPVGFKLGWLTSLPPYKEYDGAPVYPVSTGGYYTTAFGRDVPFTVGETPALNEEWPLPKPRGKVKWRNGEWVRA